MSDEREAMNRQRTITVRAWPDSTGSAQYEATFIVAGTSLATTTYAFGQRTPEAFIRGHGRTVEGALDSLFGRIGRAYVDAAFVETVVTSYGTEELERIAGEELAARNTLAEILGVEPCAEGAACHANEVAKLVTRLQDELRDLRVGLRRR